MRSAAGEVEEEAMVGSKQKPRTEAKLFVVMARHHLGQGVMGDMDKGHPSVVRIWRAARVDGAAPARRQSQ